MTSLSYINQSTLPRGRFCFVHQNYLFPDVKKTLKLEINKRLNITALYLDNQINQYYQQ